MCQAHSTKLLLSSASYKHTHIYMPTGKHIPLLNSSLCFKTELQFYIFHVVLPNLYCKVGSYCTLSSTILFIFNEGDKASIQWKWNFGFLQKILKFCLRDIFSSFKIKNLNYRLHVKNTSLPKSPCVTVPVGAGFLAVFTAAMNMYSLLGSCTLVGYFWKKSQKHGLSSLPHPHSCVCVCVTDFYSLLKQYVTKY